MANQTQIEIQTAQSIIQAHKEEQAEVNRQRDVLRQEVESAKAVNNGQMINSLVAVHDDWDAKMKDITDNLLASMIQALETSLSKLQAQDDANVIR